VIKEFFPLRIYTASIILFEKITISCKWHFSDHSKALPIIDFHFPFYPVGGSRQWTWNIKTAEPNAMNRGPKKNTPKRWAFLLHDIFDKWIFLNNYTFKLKIKLSKERKFVISMPPFLNERVYANMARIFIWMEVKLFSWLHYQCLADKVYDQ